MVKPIMIPRIERHDATDSAAAVVAHVRELIDRGALGPGARLPPERNLALQVGVSRPTVRAGLRTLAALGVIRSRRGSGTYIPEGPPTLGSEALSFLAALHKFTVDDVYEARRILEVGAAGLAAERATSDHLATLADEVAGLFASLSERQVFLVHDINFHRGIAAASGNPIVASFVEMVSALYYERRRATAERAVDRDLRDAADAHRQIYQAIRARDVDRARRMMNDHLLRARSYQAKEQPLEGATPQPRVSPVKAPFSAATAQRSTGTATRLTVPPPRSTPAPRHAPVKVSRGRRAAR